MRRRNLQPEEKKPPGPGMAALASLFGYPGAGHFWLGSHRWGLLYALTFTLGTLAMLWEVGYLLPELWKMYQGYAATISRWPNFARLALWIVLTGTCWLASGGHAALTAQRLQSTASEHFDQSIDGQKDGEQDIAHDQPENS